MATSRFSEKAKAIKLVPKSACVSFTFVDGACVEVKERGSDAGQGAHRCSGPNCASVEPMPSGPVPKEVAVSGHSKKVDRVRGEGSIPVHPHAAPQR